MGETNESQTPQGKYEGKKTIRESPTFLQQRGRVVRYHGTKIIKKVTHDKSQDQLPEMWKWGQVNAGYRDYDKTFGMNSLDEMKQWYKLHPQESAAVLELAGFGVAPSRLIQDLTNEGIGDQKTYGLALARELNSDFNTPNAELVAGNLGEIAISDNSEVIDMLKQKLQENGCRQGAALIYLRPVGAYGAIEKENGITKEGAEDFYINMFARISKKLLAPDGKFVLQIPHKIKNKNRFIERLRHELSIEFTIPNPIKNYIQKLKPTMPQHPFYITLAISRNGVRI